MLENILISESLANSTEAATSGSQEFSLASFFPLILIFAIFYFLIIRPQTKKMKEQQETINSLKSGDEIITNGGIFGVVTSANPKENFFEIQVAEGVNMKILKSSVLELVKKDNEKGKEKDKKSKGKK